MHLPLVNGNPGELGLCGGVSPDAKKSQEKKIPLKKIDKGNV